MAKERRGEEPTDRMTRMADRMTDVFYTDPEYRDGGRTRTGESTCSYVRSSSHGPCNLHRRCIWLASGDV
jgi:hypothetical protein